MTVPDSPILRHAQRHAQVTDAALAWLFDDGGKPRSDGRAKLRSLLIVAARDNEWNRIVPSWSDIGAAVGLTNHSSVMAAYKRAKGMPTMQVARRNPRVCFACGWWTQSHAPGCGGRGK